MIKFNNEIEIKLSPDKSLLQVALDNDIPLNHSCGGYGTCGTCRVIVDNHVDLPDRNPIEQEMATDRGFKDKERLACQTMCNLPIHAHIPN